MKEKIKSYFTSGWIPIASHLIAIGVFLLGILFERDWIIDAALLIFYANILGNIISSVVQIVIGQWYFIIFQLGISCVLFYWCSMLFLFSPPDYYGADKEIPQDINFEEPLDRKPKQEDFDKYDLIITYLGGSGVYSYYTDYSPKEKGYFFLKAFEITSNDWLSSEAIKKRSTIQVESMEPKVYEGEFTIYEGSSDYKYGSRIELWYQPANGNKEYKITERNYIVEGWTR